MRRVTDYLHGELLVGDGGHERVLKGVVRRWQRVQQQDEKKFIADLETRVVGLLMDALHGSDPLLHRATIELRIDQSDQLLGLIADARRCMNVFEDLPSSCGFFGAHDVLVLECADCAGDEEVGLPILLVPCSNEKVLCSDRVGIDVAGCWSCWAKLGPIRDTPNLLVKQQTLHLTGPDIVVVLVEFIYMRDGSIDRHDDG